MLLLLLLLLLSGSQSLGSILVGLSDLAKDDLQRQQLVRVHPGMLDDVLHKKVWICRLVGRRRSRDFVHHALQQGHNVGRLQGCFRQARVDHGLRCWSCRGRA